MADNSIMKNVSQVETYGKNLQQVQQQVREIFKKLQAQTKSIGSVWQDAQFKQFEADFNQNIVKAVNEMTVKMENEANYIKNVIALQRQIQAQKIR